jgi:large subunit ribosomal protein L20
MPRVKRSVPGRKKRRALLKKAKGYYSSRGKHYRAAREQVMHSGVYAYRDRKARKGDFRKLWIMRINAAARENGLSYSRMISGLRLAEVEVDRKMLAELAVNDPPAFAELANLANQTLEKAS